MAFFFEEDREKLHLGQVRKNPYKDADKEDNDHNVMKNEMRNASVSVHSTYSPPDFSCTSGMLGSLQPEKGNDYAGFSCHMESEEVAKVNNHLLLHAGSGGKQSPSSNQSKLSSDCHASTTRQNQLIDEHHLGSGNVGSE